MRYFIAAVAAAATVLAAAGCTASPGTQGPGAGSGSGGSGAGSGSQVPVRLGYIADVTQGTAMVGIREGLFSAALGHGVALKAISFATPSAEAAALATGKLDAAYVSPETILTVLTTPHASPIVVISGVSAAEPKLVVNRRITAPSALRGHTLAVPAADSGSDLALRGWLAAQHLRTGGADGVAVTAMPPGPSLIAAFRSGKIDGAVELPPWDLELTAAGGRTLANQPGSARFGSAPSATANLVVTRKFLDANSAAVYGLLRGQVQANDFLRHNLLEASRDISSGLAAAGDPVSTDILALSMAQVSFTDDPLAPLLAAQVREAAADGFAAPATIPPGLYDFAPLDLILRAAGEPPVTK